MTPYPLKPAQTAIKKMWRIFATGSNSILELRALWPKCVPNSRPPVNLHFRANEYSSIDELKGAFEAAALDLNVQGFNIYTVMNPISSNFAGPGNARDVDIAYRDLLLVDIDRIGDTSCPADQQELEAALALAKRISDHMSAKGWSDPIVVMSGNGYHLYYVLSDMPNNEESAALVRATLKNLATTFNDNIVGVDTTVYNASRITKVPGTIMRKGVATVERPYRMAEVCDEE